MPANGRVDDVAVAIMMPARKPSLISAAVADISDGLWTCGHWVVNVAGDGARTL